MTDDTRRVFPFAALVGQEELKLALLLNVVDPGIGGVMIMGHRGTAKSTAVRGLAQVMPPLDRVRGCAFNCEPAHTVGLCERCLDEDTTIEAESVPVPVVDLPLGATEDRVAGTLDLEAALLRGTRSFDPGLLARAHRGFLYIDEANLLEDHLVELLLDVAAAGVNVVEREAVSVRHPARFVLVGSGNPEEGELRPQLLDRFGLYVDVITENDPAARAEVVRRRLAYDDDPDAFTATWQEATDDLRGRLERARGAAPSVGLPDGILETIAALNAELAIDGHRGELTMARAARAHAALEGRGTVELDDVRRVAAMALRHRMRRDPLETRDGAHRIDQALARHLPE